MAEMAQVTRDEFYARIGPLDVHPRSERDVTVWELRDRTVIGKSYPGYVPLPNGKKTYFLVKRT